MAQQDLRIGIWGSGFMAGVHGKGLAALPGVRVVGIASRNPRAAAAVAPDAQVVPDVDALLTTVGIDALVACVPPGVHGGEVEAAAAAGVHCLLEKPIALDWQRAESIAAAVTRHGVHHQVGFHLRFARGVERARELVASGEAGPAVQFLARYWARMDGKAWWRDPALGGGQLIEQAIHCYDLAHHLFGPIAGVSAQLATLAHGSDYAIDDVSVALLRFASGALGSVAATSVAIPERFIGDWRAAWRDLSIDATADGDWRSTDHTRLHRADGDGSPSETIAEDRDCHAAVSADFVAAIRADRPTRCSVPDALGAHAAVFAAHASAARGGAMVAPERWSGG